jgi:hypothetical protein
VNRRCGVGRVEESFAQAVGDRWTGEALVQKNRPIGYGFVEFLPGRFARLTLWMCGSTSPGTAVRPLRSITVVSCPEPGARPPTATNRPLRIVTVLAIVLRSSIVWIRPFVSTSV